MPSIAATSYNTITDVIRYTLECCKIDLIFSGHRCARIIGVAVGPSGKLIPLVGNSRENNSVKIGYCIAAEHITIVIIFLWNIVIKMNVVNRSRLAASIGQLMIMPLE